LRDFETTILPKVVFKLELGDQMHELHPIPLRIVESPILQIGFDDVIDKG
jgi:hypothetical protein